jgi:hypothetical protein
MECLRSITPLAHLTLPKRQQNRIRDLRPKFARTRGQSRSSTAIEYPRPLGRRGFDSHRERQFRRAVEFGLSVKSERMSGFKPRAIRQLMDSQLALCPSHQCVGRLIEGYCPPKMRRADDETLLEVSICSLRSIFDGSQDWVIAHNDVVAGSSPASGTKCRSSSVAEHVIPSSFLIRRSSCIQCDFDPLGFVLNPRPTAVTERSR